MEVAEWQCNWNTALNKGSWQRVEAKSGVESRDNLICRYLYFAKSQGINDVRNFFVRGFENQFEVMSALGSDPIERG